MPTSPFVILKCAMCIQTKGCHESFLQRAYFYSQGENTKQQLKFVLIKEVLFWVGHVGAYYDAIKNDVHFVLKWHEKTHLV